MAVIAKLWFLKLYRIVTWSFTTKLFSRESVPQNVTEEKSTLVMARLVWFCQATNHYLNQCWPSSMSSHSLTRPQCLIHELYIHAKHITSYLRSNKQWYTASEWKTKGLFNIKLPCYQYTNSHSKNKTIILNLQWEHQYMETGGRLNKKDGLTRYGNSHVKDKTS